MKKYLIFGIVLACIVACQNEEFLDYQLADPAPRICLSGFVCPDSVFIVLTTNKKWMDTTKIKTQYLDNAQVYLYENDLLIDTLKSMVVNDVYDYYTRQKYPMQYYVSRKSYKVLSRYRIEAQCPGYPSVSAETYLPNPIILSRIDTSETIPTFQPQNITLSDTILIPLYNEKYWLFIGIQITDPTFEKNYYRVQCNPYYFFNTSIYDFNSDDYNNILYWTRIFSDQRINGETITLLFQYYYSRYYDTTYLYLAAISEETYKFYTSYYKYSLNKFDITSERMQLYSNVVNGYGMFEGINEKRITLIAKPLWKNR